MGTEHTRRSGREVALPSPVQAGVPKRTALRSRARWRSTSRSLGGAVVVRWASRCAVACATASTASSKAAWFAWLGLVLPLTLRTYCSAAARTSSEVAGGSKLWSCRMLRHIPRLYVAPPSRGIARVGRGENGALVGAEITSTGGRAG